MGRAAVVSLLFLVISLGCGNASRSSSASGDDGDRVVIDVEGRVVTADRLARNLEDFRGDSLLVDKAVSSIVHRLLFLHDAHARGLDDNSEFRRYAYERKREKLNVMWLSRVLNENVTLPPDSVENFYARMGEKVIYTAVLVEDRSLADSLREAVLRGSDMNVIAENFSINPIEAGRGGKIGPRDRLEVLRYDAPLLEGLQPGQVSRVDSLMGNWRFVKLDTVYEYQVPPFSQLRDAIEAKILGYMRTDYKRHLLDSIRKECHLEIDSAVVRLVASHFLPGGMLSYEPFSEEEEELAVYTYDGGSRNVRDFAANVSHLPPVSERDPSDPDWMAEYARLLGTYEIMTLKACEMGMDTLPEVRKYLDRKVENHLLDIYYDSVISPRIVLDEDRLRELYEERRDSLYVPEFRVFKTVAAVGKEQLELLRKILDEGGDPYGMVDRFTEVTRLLDEGERILTRPIYRSDVPRVYGDMLFDAELGETVLCSISTDKVVAFEPVEINPRHPATFEESRDKLKIVLKHLKEKEVLAALLDSLSSVCRVEIDSAFVREFYREPQQARE